MMESFKTTYDSENKIWSGPQQTSVYRHGCSVGKVIFATMKNYPKNICQISEDDGIVLTFEKALLLSIRIAQNLKKKGLTRDHVIGISAKNSTYLMPLAVACLMNTIPFHSINPGMDESDTKHVFDITKPTLIFCDGENYEKIRAATKSINAEIYTLRNHIENVPKIEDLLEPTGTEMLFMPEPLVDGGDQTMVILCSSGTTGPPKAVCVSNSTLIQDGMLVDSESVIYSASGLGWITGLWCFMFSVVFGSTRIISIEPFSPEYFVKLVEKYKVTYALLPAEQVSWLIRSNLATRENMQTVKMLSYGGGKLSGATLELVQKIFVNTTLNSGYGMTEVGAICLNLGMGKNTYATGKLVPGIRARIVDENGKNLGYNEVGEIYLHHGRTWNGYYKNPVDSKQLQDADGWFHTGDLGYFKDDDYLQIVDRKKEILKYKGAHFWPSEIEHVITEMPEVLDVCIVGVEDENWGDAAGALIVKHEGSTLKEEDVAEFVRKRIPAISKHLHGGVIFVDKIPKNTNGKTVRNKAKELFLSLKP